MPKKRNTLLLVILLLFAAGVLSGCDGNVNLNDEMVTKVGTELGETVTDFVAGWGEGIKKDLNVHVELTKELADCGLSITTSKVEERKKGGKVLTVYLIAEKSLHAELLAKALDENDAEIGRAGLNVQLGQDDARYVSFYFPAEMELSLVRKYVIGLKK